MARAVKEIEDEIRTLSADDRNHLLRDLIVALDRATDNNVEEAWISKAKQRNKELEDGIVNPIPAEEIFSEAKARLKN